MPLSEIEQKKADDLWQRLSRPSPARFRTFALDGDSDAMDAVARYAWNTMLCQALMPAFGAAEVLLRNGIHNSLTRAYSTPLWWEGPIRLTASMETSLMAARRDLEQEGNFRPSPDDLVAALSFSFWTCLLDAGFEASVYRHFVRNALPHAPKDEHSRENVEQIFQRIRKLRNKAYHNKPIWRRVEEIVSVHQDAVKVVGWMSRPHATLLRATDNLDQVARVGQLELRKRVIRALQTDLAIPAGELERALS